MADLSGNGRRPVTTDLSVKGLMHRAPETTRSEIHMHHLSYNLLEVASPKWWSLNTSSTVRQTRIRADILRWRCERLVSDWLGG